MHADGDCVVFFDGDMDITPDQIGEYLEQIPYGDIVIASKRHPNSNYEAPYIRKLSMVFNVFVNYLLNVDILDTQTGLKIMRKKEFEKIFQVLSVKRYAFDVELLLLARLNQKKIIIMPVDLKISKSKIDFKQIFQMVADVLKIWYRLKIKKICIVDY